jgi:type IV pilus assembly protein PilM
MDEQPFSFEVELVEDQQSDQIVSEEQQKIVDEAPLPPRYWPEELFGKNKLADQDNQQELEIDILSSPFNNHNKALPQAPLESSPLDNAELAEIEEIEDLSEDEQDHLPGPVIDVDLQPSTDDLNSSGQENSTKNLKQTAIDLPDFELEEKKGFLARLGIKRKPKKEKIKSVKPRKFSKPTVKPSKGKKTSSKKNQTVEVKGGQVKIVKTDLDQDKFEQQRLKRAERRSKRQQKAQKKKARSRKKESQDVTVVFKNLQDKHKQKKKDKEKQKQEKQDQLVRLPEKKKKKPKKKKSLPNPLLKVKDWLKKKQASRSRKIQKDIVGLHIGASSIRAVLLDSDQPVVYQFDIPEGIIINGKLEEPEELSRVLRDLWQESKLPSKKVNFSVANNEVILRVKKMAARKESDIRQALSMNSDILFDPLDPKHLRMDYTELSRSGQALDLQVVAADEDMVKEYANAVEKAGLLAVNCESGAVATNRAFKIPYSANKAHLIVDVGAEITSVTACAGVDTLFMRSLALGGNDFTEAVQNKLQVTWLEAEELKKRSGVAQQPADPTLDLETFSACKQALQPLVDRLAQEILLTKNQYETEDNGRVISSWSLIGGASRLSGIGQQAGLFTKLKDPIVLEPYPGFETISDLDVNGTVLGLARGFEMSLLPEASANSNVMSVFNRQKSKLSSQKAKKNAKQSIDKQGGRNIPFKLIGIFMAVAILCGGFFYNSQKSIEAGSLQVQIDSLETELLTRFGPKPAPAYYNSEISDQASEKIFSSPDSALLREVNGIFSASSIDNLTYETTGSRLTVSGVRNPGTPLNKLLDEIKTIPGLENSQLKNNGPNFSIITIIEPYVKRDSGEEETAAGGGL